MQAFASKNLSPRIHYRPLFFAALSAAFGAYAAFYLSSGGAAAALCLFFCALAATVCACRLSPRAFLSAALCLFAWAAVFSAGRGYIGAYRSAALGGEGLYSVTGKVTKVTDRSVILSSLRMTGEEGRFPAKGKLVLYTEGDFDLGDVLVFEGKVGDAEGMYYLASGIRYAAQGGAERTDSRPDFFQKINRALHGAMIEGMGERTGNLGAALVLGRTAETDGDMTAAFRAGGVAHIFAVSGLHIGFLAGLLALIMRRMPRFSPLPPLIVSALLFAYAGVCGFTPSSLRAAVMCSVSLVAASLGRKYDGLNALSLAALFLLLVRPANIADIGFGLSVTAALSLVVFSRPAGVVLFDCARRVFRLSGNEFTRPRIFRAASALGAVLAVQVGTLPLVLSAFGYVAALGVLFNLLLLPLVALIYPLAMIGSVLSLFGGAEIFLFLPSLGLRLCFSAVLLPDIGSVALSFSPLMSVFYCGMLAAFAEPVRMERFTRAAIFLGCAALFVLSSLLFAYIL